MVQFMVTFLGFAVYEALYVNHDVPGRSTNGRVDSGHLNEKERCVLDTAGKPDALKQRTDDAVMRFPLPAFLN